MNFIGVADGLVDEQRAFAVMNNLMNFYNPSASIIDIYGDRFDMWIEDGPLPSPILANAFMTIDEAAFHAVRPHHVRLHAGQDGIDIAGVEIAIGAFEEFAFGSHACTPFRFGVGLKIGRGKRALRWRLRDSGTPLFDGKVEEGGAKFKCFQGGAPRLGGPHHRRRRGEKAPLGVERCGKPVPERYEEQAAAAATDAE